MAVSRFNGHASAIAMPVTDRKTCRGAIPKSDAKQNTFESNEMTQWTWGEKSNRIHPEKRMGSRGVVPGMSWSFQRLKAGSYVPMNT